MKFLEMGLDPSPPPLASKPTRPLFLPLPCSLCLAFSRLPFPPSSSLHSPLALFYSVLTTQDEEVIVIKPILQRADECRDNVSTCTLVCVSSDTCIRTHRADISQIEHNIKQSRPSFNTKTHGHKTWSSFFESVGGSFTINRKNGRVFVRANSSIFT